MAAAAAATDAPSPRAAAVQAATANEALYYGGGDGERLEPSTLTPAYSDGESGGWWDGHERREGAFAYQHQQHGQHVPETSASAAAHPPPGGSEPPRSPPTPSAGWNSTHDRGGGVSGGGDVGSGGGGMYDARSQIQRIIDDAVRNGTGGRGAGPVEGNGFTPIPTRFGNYRRRESGPDAGGNGEPLLCGIDSSRRSARAGALAATAATGLYSGGAGSRLPTRATKSDSLPTSAPESGRLGGLSVAGRKAGGGGGGGGSGNGGGGTSSRTALSPWAQLGPRAVTREDLTRLDEEIANLSKTVEQVRL